MTRDWEAQERACYLRAVLWLTRSRCASLLLAAVQLLGPACANTADLGSRRDSGVADLGPVDAGEDASVCEACEVWQACDTLSMSCVDCDSIEGGCVDRRSSIAVSRYHTCAIRGDGELYCWGANSSGECGQSNLSTINVPQRVTTLSNVVDVATVASRTCVRTNVDGSTQALCFGLGIHGELGSGDRPTIEPMPTPVRTEVGALDSANELSLGALHTCIRRRDATVLCAGDNSYGQAGGSELDTDVLVPVPVRNAVSVAASDWHTCVAIPSGPVLCWGSNADGRLGMEGAFAPSTVPGIDRAVRVAGGYAHTCALNDTGSVVCWGLNDFAQLSGDLTSNLPREVAGLADVRDIAAGGNHSCALTEGGRLLCWGSNDEGQLGQPASVPQLNVPTEVPNLPTQGNLIEIAVGGDRTCALAASTAGDGELYCFGDGLGRLPVLISFPDP